MFTLGIETSCDETSASIVNNGKEVLSLIVSSSLNFHKKYGGIIPEIAFRKQLETISGVADCAIKDAGIKLRDVGLLGVTENPGLLGSLLVGISFAKAVSAALKIPLVGVNHLYGHIYASFLGKISPRFPCVALVVSGGHTSLFYLKDFTSIETLGTTQDDACGEAFDKVAKILGLGYPGGPLIEQISRKGDPNAIAFGCSQTRGALDFSFSGIKTAVLYYAKKNLRPGRNQGRKIADICASFQKTVITTLVEKSLLACKMKKIKHLVVSGGVAANASLRDAFLQKAQEGHGIKCFFPSKELCTDNAAMIGGLAYQIFKKGKLSNGG